MDSTLVVLVSKNVYRLVVGLASDDMPLLGVLAAGECVQKRAEEG